MLLRSLQPIRSNVPVCILSSQDGATPLLTASCNGHSQVAKLLLVKGADVNLSMQVTYTLTPAKTEFMPCLF